MTADAGIRASVWLDGIQIAYRARMLSNGSVSVGTIHVVKVKP